jgi:hypothetical protein
MSITAINAAITMVLPKVGTSTWFKGQRFYMLKSSLRPLSGGGGKEG